MTWKNIFLKTAVFISIFGIACWLQAQSPISISVDTEHPGTPISPDFSGLSFETSLLLPDANGVRYFRPDNQPLITLFQTLGIKSLRVGGNTSDRSATMLPDKADLDSLFAFAKAAGVKVIYCLRLRNGNPEEDAQTVKYIMDHYPEQIACFSIGQEANIYPKTLKTNSVQTAGATGVFPERPSYALYAKEWKQFESSIITTVPSVKFCGPSVDGNPTWVHQFMRDFGHDNHVILITSHLYPGGSGFKVPSPEFGRNQMLSGGFTNAYQKLYDGFAADTLAEGLSYRLEEANSYFNGGATDVSDTFTSALWGLDFMYWWAEHDAAGLNFHTGDKVAAGDELRPSRYTAYVTITNGLFIRPLGYGIKAFDLGGHGSLLSARISNPENLNISVYAVLENDKDIYVTVINKEHGDQGKAAEVSLGTDVGFADAQIMALTASNGDIAAKTGITLGGSQINSEGQWSGVWSELTPRKMGLLTIEIPAASASIIRLMEN